jgi:hypothetical protein
MESYSYIKHRGVGAQRRISGETLIATRSLAHKSFKSDAYDQPARNSLVSHTYLGRPRTRP